LPAPIITLNAVIPRPMREEPIVGDKP